MSGLESVHEDHGARFVDFAGRRVVDEYGRPARAHRAVRNGVGFMERPFGIVALTGADRHEFVDNAVSNSIPRDEGSGSYAFLLDPNGDIATDMYVLNGGDRLLVVTPPGRASPLVDEWREKTFIQDVSLDLLSEDLVVFGVHGPMATEKVASVFSVGTPEKPLSFVRGRLGDKGVTVVRDDGLAGEVGYLVVASADDGERVFGTLAHRGLNAPPFGWRTWASLTLEAGTPLFESELAGRRPTDLGLGYGVDYDKGCFVGQEVVSRIRNRGQPSQRLVGLHTEQVPEAEAAIVAGDDPVGHVTRAMDAPSLDRSAAFALIDFDCASQALRVESDTGPIAADRVPLPFYEGSARSLRVPIYD